MSTETGFRSEVVSKVAVIEETSGFSGDCNGGNKHVEEDTNHHPNGNGNGNGNGKDDPDGSYVFVSRSDSSNGDLVNRDLVPEPEDMGEGQVEELNDEIASVKRNCMDEGVEVEVEVAPEDGSLVQPNGAGDEDVMSRVRIATAIVGSGSEEGINGGSRIEEKKIEPDSAFDLEEDRECPITLSEVGQGGRPQLDDGEDDGKVETEEETNLNSTTELGEEVRESQMLVAEVEVEDEEEEASDLHEGEDKPEKQNEKSNEHFGGSEKAQIVDSEPSECKSSMLDDGKLDSNIDLSPEVEGSLESQAMVSEVAAECKSPEVEVQLDDAGEMESEEQINLNSELGEVQEVQMPGAEVDDIHGEEEEPENSNTKENVHFRESEEAPIAYSESSECKSSVLVDQNSEQQAPIAYSESSECKSSVLVDRNSEQQAPIAYSESSECKSSVLVDRNSEQPANMELLTEPQGSQESKVMVSEAAAECKSPEAEVSKVIADKKTMLESPQHVKECLESQTTNLESAESKSDQLDDGEKLDVEKRMDSGFEVRANQESQPVVTDDLLSGTDVLNKGAQFTNETIPLEVETAAEHVLDENNVSCPTSHVEVLNELMDSSPNTMELNGSENTKCLPSPADSERPESEVRSEPVEESILCCPAKDTKLEIQLQNDTVGGDVITSCDEVSSGNGTELPCGNPAGIVCSLSGADVTANSLNPEYHANDSLQNESGGVMESESQFENCPPISVKDMPCSDDALSQSEVLDSSVVYSGSEVNDGDGDDFDNLACQKNDTECDHKNEISTPIQVGSSADALNEQSASVESVKRPFHFLIKIPRYDDENLREEIRLAQLQVIEETRQRDAIQADIKMINVNCKQLRHEIEAAKSEVRSARGLVKLKRQEIDSVQSVINRVKNAISVEDIDVRINNMEHMIQHEVLLLKEEKQFIREIKQLKHLREQLSSNMGSQDEVQQALDQRDQTEERMKMLKKELDCLKDKLSTAQSTFLAAEKKLNEESQKLKGPYTQFRAADKVRQQAYMNLQKLKSQLYEKNTRFRTYKDDVTAAYDYASSGDKGALHRLCVNQVETLMDLWNKNDEFREEYLRCNTRSTLRRLRTSDGRALGPDEEPTALPSVMDERIDKSLPTPCKTNSELPNLTLEQEKQVSNVAGKETDGKSMVKVAEHTEQTAKTQKPGKPTLRAASATDSGRDKTEEMSEEEHNKQTKEEQELARKEEELRKEEATAKLKEQRRLEEMAKAKEALERKKRNAEKAQIRAELRAQKEAELKEKEKDKRAKKKDKKKGPDGNNEGEALPTSEFPVVTTKEPETEESHLTTTRRPQKSFQFTKQSKTKSIPPPLRNRGKRRMQQWIWAILTAVVVLALFLVGNIGFYSTLGHNLRMRSYGF